ncbi:MAG TPA: pyridoxamine 5'-phosphate oxidase family protein [Microlunatus sp.]|nr:pyridoxamine 5'-phosphate oxidase family protein [Microlunatus sp.]
MASSSPVAGPRRHRLSTHECRSWLIQHHEGRLDYRTGRGPRSLVVRYAVDSDAVLVRVPTFNDLLQYAPGESVTLEVDDRVALDSVAPGGAIQTGFESVHVTGTATIVDSAPPALADDWPADLPTKVISVPIQRIDGFYAAAP